MTEDVKTLVEKIRGGEIDVNNQTLFFGAFIKGLILKLNKDITIRKKPVPTFILHTGDDTMYLDVKGQDASIEPGEISNEKYVYNAIPRCIVQPKNVDILSDQVSSPYAKGSLQLTHDGDLYTLVGEMRRYPIKMAFDLTYYLDNYTDSLELIQQIISKLTFIQTYKISYMGQEILCSYAVPTQLSEEHLMTLEGTTTERKDRKIAISLEVETNYPVWQNRTIVSASQWISKFNYGVAAAPSQEIQKAQENMTPEYEGGDGLVIHSKKISNRDI